MAASLETGKVWKSKLDTSTCTWISRARLLQQLYCMCYPAYFQNVPILAFVFWVFFAALRLMNAKDGGKSGNRNLASFFCIPRSFLPKGPCYIYNYAEANFSKKLENVSIFIVKEKKKKKNRPETGATASTRHLSFIFIFHLGLPQSPHPYLYFAV